MSAFQSWRVGDVEIVAVVESRVAVPSQFLFPEATADQFSAISWLSPHYIDSAGLLWIAIQALAVRTPSQDIVIDTCVGNDKRGLGIPTWNGLQTAFLDDLAKTGFDRMKVGTVLCTHMHPDHVGWNTMLVGERWVPTFPNARHLVAKNEFDHWRGETGNPGTAAMFEQSIEPILNAGLLQTVDPHHRICDEISLIPTPGHTPGHVSVRIESNSEAALITGDFIHHPSQMAHPEWREIADTDAAMAQATRKAMLRDCADRPLLVIGTHFPAPAGGHVVRDGAAYRFAQN